MALFAIKIALAGPLLQMVPGPAGPGESPQTKKGNAMSVDSVGNGQSLTAVMMAAKMAVANKPQAGESGETAAQESAESAQVQAAEGELGGNIDTYA